MVPGKVLKASEPKRSLESSDDKSWVRMEEDLAAPLLLGLLLTGGWKREQDMRNRESDLVAGVHLLPTASRGLHWDF